MAERSREIRKHLMIMVALILAIDAIAIALHTALGIGDAPRRTKTIFTVVWTVVTVAAVLNGLYRIRLARHAGGTPPRRR